MKPINLIFTGTAQIATPLLKALAKDGRFSIPMVITQEDRPAGRKMELAPSPIKKNALECGLNVYQPENINSEESLENIQSHQPDMMLVFAYGQILKKKVRNLPKMGCLNVHTSLLPKYRGASPIQAALLNGERQTGISLMQIEKGMDSGPVFEQFSIPIQPEDNAQILHDKLAELSAEKIPDLLIKIAQEQLSPTPQNHNEATHVSKIEKSDGQIDWSEDVTLVANKVRAYYSWPSAYTFFKSKRLKIHEAIPHPGQMPKNPGHVIQVRDFVGVVCQGGILELINVQLEGKKAQSIQEFLNGNLDFITSRLN